MSTYCRIEMLGGLRVCLPDRVITRFRTRQTGALLVCLALDLETPHPRERLIGLLWPDAEPESGRNSLRIALSSLRHQLEPPGVPAGTVLLADRRHVQLRPEAVATDVAEFEATLRAAGQAVDDPARVEPLARVVALYRGDLLPGYYEEWVLEERRRLEEACLGALRRLARGLVQAGDFDQAREYARRAVQMDPLREEAHRDLMRLYVATGQPSAALRQYVEMERLLREELGEAPTAASRALAEQIRARAQVPPRRESRERADEAPAMPAEEAVAPDGGVALPGTPSPAARLPRAFTRFFGRAEELERIRALLASGIPLLTLTGPGGTGKTRLALEAARAVVDAFGGAVWFVPLADLSDPRRIPEAIAAAMGLSLPPQGDPLGRVAEHLGGQGRAVLLLDNMEHLLYEDRRKGEDGAAVVRALLERVPALTCLVTSRQSLGLEGEREFPVAPLPTPEYADDPACLGEVTSVQLFVDRAQAVQPDFQVTERNAAAVAEVCRRLDGVPLALELAAARIKMLTPALMAQQMGKRFDWLVSRRRDVEERHRTLRDAIDWSYRLLAPELQRFFCRLSVFRGGWSVEAAEAVCEEPRAREYLGQLQDCCLVQADPCAACEQTRFRMLETLREYGWEHLMPEEREGMDHAFLGYFAALAGEARHVLFSRRQLLWLNRLEKDYANIQAALEKAKAEPPLLAVGLKLVCDLYVFWDTRAYYPQVLSHLNDFLSPDIKDLPMGVHAYGLQVFGHFNTFDYPDKARALLELSLELARQIGNDALIAGALLELGRILEDVEKAQAMLEEALALFRKIGDRVQEGYALHNLANVLVKQGDLDRARALLEESAAVQRSVENAYGEWDPLIVLSRLATDSAEKKRLLLKALDISRTLDRKVALTWCLEDLGQIAFAEGRLEDALGYYEEYLQVGYSMEYYWGGLMFISRSLAALARILRTRGEYRAARNRMLESVRAWYRVGSQEERSFRIDELAYIEHGRGRHERSARLLGAASLLREHEKYGRWPGRQAEYDAHIAFLQQALGDAAYRTAWEAGCAMTWEQTVAFALEEDPAD